MRREVVLACPVTVPYVRHSIRSTHWFVAWWRCAARIAPWVRPWCARSPPPKLTPHALAKAIVAALRDGVEDVYPGDVAQELLERWRENPKVLERELGIDGA